MSDIAIICDGLSKQYRIGERESYKALRDVISDAAAAPFRRLQSALKPNGTSSNGSHSSLITHDSSLTADTQFWALQDVSFEVKRGEVVGIIGRNGAGKSTLLKILSRITKPTKGHAEIHGRVGSLLEVGTGFHPELTGRENIYLNAAILGMRKAEIAKKFDEIVAFAEVEKFIDTPVKRYSSGMYVRLAFAVAAHMDTEVLLVDEVLAVGDAEFQRKCLGKMGEAASDGRTIFFVSHSMQAILQLTTRCMLLAHGRLDFFGATPEAVALYMTSTSSEENLPIYTSSRSEGSNYLEGARVVTSGANGVHDWGYPIEFEFTLRVDDPCSSLCFSFQVINDRHQAICHFWLFESNVPYRYKPGIYRLRCKAPRFRLYMGRYTLTTWLSDRRSGMTLETLSQICPFEVSLERVPREEYQWEPMACAYLEDVAWQPVERLHEEQPLSLEV